jgi:leucyl-tRNA synthetase
MQGHTQPVVDTAWPKAEAALLAEDSVTVAIQVNGKRRDEIRLPKGATKDEVEPLVMARDAVIRSLEGKPVKKFIVVPDRIINIVV